MTDPVEQDYFNWDFQSSIFTTGLVMLPLMMLHGFDYYFLTRLQTGLGKDAIKLTRNSWENIAWGTMIGGNMTWNGFMWVVWAFSFIQSAFFQQSMFWSFVVGFGLNAINQLCAAVFFIVGGSTYGGSSWFDVYMSLITSAITIGYHAILIWGLGPQVASFYRWHEQDWWTFGDFLRNGTMEDEIDAFD